MLRAFIDWLIRLGLLCLIGGGDLRIYRILEKFEKEPNEIRNFGSK